MIRASGTKLKLGSSERWDKVKFGWDSCGTPLYVFDGNLAPIHDNVGSGTKLLTRPTGLTWSRPSGLRRKSATQARSVKEILS